VNLQKLEGSLKPQDSGRFGQACPEHRVRRCSASLSSVSPEHALALQAVVRVTSPSTIPSSAIASHVVIPFLLLPACEWQALSGTCSCLTLHTSDDVKAFAEALHL
jgi:hypothetical protein